MEASWSTFTLLVTTLIAVVFIKLLVSLYRQLTHWKKYDVPSNSGIPFFGTGWRFLLKQISVPEFCEYIYNFDKDSRYVCTMDFMTPGVVLRDPELIKEIAIKNFDNFPDHRAFVDESMDPIFGKNVFSLRGERWKEMRNTLSPSFTASKMRFMFELVSKCSKDFADYLYDHPEFSGSIECKDACRRYTTDVIASAAFGINVNSLENRNNEFYMHGKDVTSSFSSILGLIKFVLFRINARLTRMVGFRFLSRSTSKFFNRVVSEAVKLRDEQGIVRPDMIHLLMQARDKDTPSNQLTIADIIAQAFIFFLAGFDTSSTLMCYVFLELALNPEVQSKLRDEVDRCIEEGGGQITYDGMAKMEYMEMVISETLRKFPPVVIIDRVCSEKFEMPPAKKGGQGITVEPNNLVWLPIYAIQRDPQYFPDPEKFDPERFSEENKDKIVPYTYLPFGVGPRKCIGNRFALMETKVLIAHILHRFNINRTEKTCDKIVYDKNSFSIHLEGGFWVGLEKREK